MLLFFRLLPPSSGGVAGSGPECSWDCYQFEVLLEGLASPGKQGRCRLLENVFIFGLLLPNDVHGTSQYVN